jgi:hypothetical protein
MGGKYSGSCRDFRYSESIRVTTPRVRWLQERYRPFSGLARRLRETVCEPGSVSFNIAVISLRGFTLFFIGGA